MIPLENHGRMIENIIFIIRTGVLLLGNLESSSFKEILVYRVSEARKLLKDRCFSICIISRRYLFIAYVKISKNLVTN